MAVLIGSYLLLMFVLPLAVSGVISYRALPSGCRCTRCGGDTIRLASRPLRLLSALDRRATIQRRWCLCCGWEGAVRQQEPATARPAAQTLDVKLLDVDGAPWRVMLQCWTTRDLCYGRLLFVSPSGRLWLDALETFSAESERDVLGQARSLPEPVLALRLRRLASG